MDLSDPQIQQTVDAVVDDKNEDVEYAIFDVEPSPLKLVVATSGKGGLAEVKEHLNPEKLQFAYYRTIAGDEESKRVKFIFISWAGDHIKSPKLRAKMSILKMEVKQVIKNFHIEIHATDVGDLDEEDINKMIKKAMGADYSFNTSSL